MAVKALNGGLETSLLGRSKHRGCFQPQTEPDHSPDRVSELVSTLEKRVIVKLSKARQSHRTPMFPQRLKDCSGVELAHGPGGHQTSVQRNTSEHAHFGTTFDHQPFYDIETIQLAVSQRQRRQIPTRLRCTAAHASLPIQRPSALQDAPDGANRRRIGQSLDQPLSSNGRCAKFSEIAILAQLVAYPD